jgi:thiol-disulfide isomerase/thioredoxin
MRPQRIWRRSTLPVVALLALVGLAACDPDAATPETDGAAVSVENPFDDCPAPVIPSPGAESKPAGGSDLIADLTLPCLAGGSRVTLRALGQPAVINLWASWCPPCRTELPEFQKLADSTGGRLLVLGVDTGDTVNAASSAASDLGVNFPSVFDSSEELRRSVGKQFLPVTLFVDGQGLIRHVDTSGALTRDEMVDLVGQHLGLTVG